jgi:alpha-L-fucosidase
MDRRAFVASLAALPVALDAAARDRANAPGARPRPTHAQLAWQRDELAMFIHFGVNTFTDREWGDGTESPSVFNPTALDARQWARTARAAGFKAMILTAKHHDGFCLWPTRTTTHSVASSPWREGRGDLVREFVDACRAENLKPGLYLSPWDRHAPVYGDSPRYNDRYIAQLTELLTLYGEIHEVWFDGANGEGPNGKRQTYDWPRTWNAVRRLQPNAVMFSDAGPDVRWIGNERGSAGTTNWSTVDPRIVTVPGMSGDEVMRSLQDGDRDGTVWRPGETDVSIRPGWFHHPAEDDAVRSADDLVQLYFSSVGRNSKLLLNVPPGRDGLLQAADVASLQGMRARLDSLFANNLVTRGAPLWKQTGARTAVCEVALGMGGVAGANVGIIDLREDITNGQRVAAYRIEVRTRGTWREVLQGTTIGHRKLERISVGTIQRLRVTIEDAVEAPQPLRIACYGPG